MYVYSSWKMAIKALDAGYNKGYYLKKTKIGVILKNKIYQKNNDKNNKEK